MKSLVELFNEAGPLSRALHEREEAEARRFRREQMFYDFFPGSAGDRLQHVLRKISYRPGWTFSMYDYGSTSLLRTEFGILIRASVPDRDDPSRTIPLNFRTAVHVHDGASEADVAREVLRRILEFEHHEACEFFKLDGDRLFDPHERRPVSPPLPETPKPLKETP